MTVLLKAADLVRRPVVTLAGEAVGQIKDVIYSAQSGELSGFTLNGRGVFSGPLRKTLPWENVHGLGPAAVMIRDESSLADRKALRAEPGGGGGSVLGSRVITQSGRILGVVTDVILAVGETMTDAVGYEIDPVDSSAPRRQFVPLPDTLAVSSEALMLPDAATDFIRDDLAGFGAAVEEFRTRLRGRGQDSPSPEVTKASPSPEVTKDPPRPEVPKDPPRPEVPKDSPRLEVPKDSPRPETTQDSPRPSVTQDSPPPDVIKGVPGPTKNPLSRTKELPTDDARDHR